MIRIGERPPLAAPRRVALGVDKWMALQRAAEAAQLRLPPQLRLEIEPVDAALAGVDVEAGLAEAAALLRAHGVLDEDGSPVPAVAANLAALGSAERLARVSLAGPDTNRLGHYWVDARIGGSLVRDGLTHTLSLFDARAIGSEILGLVPDAEHAEGDRSPFAVPLVAVGPVAGVGDVPGDVLAAMGDFAGLHPRDVTRLHEWSRRNLAVLHVSAVGRGRPPYALVWFLDRDGWWSGRTTGTGKDRLLHLTPRGRGDLATALGDLVTGAWL